MNIRLFNAKIAQFTPVTRLIDGEVWVEGDRVTHAGNTREMPPRFDREIDCRGGVLLPGFKNAHTHSAMTFLRSHADDLPLQEWLFEQVFPFEGQLTESDVDTLVRLAILEYVSGGQTAAMDMYFHLDAAVNAAVESGFRFVLVGSANDHGGSAKETEAEYKKYNAIDPLISYRMGIHAEYTTAESLIRDHAELAKQYREPFFTHLSETKAEVEGCYARYGMSPIEKLDRLGAFDFGGGGYHMVHVSERDLAIMQEKHLFAVTCPASNLKLASGIAPVSEFLRRGIPVAIGTDGAASNNCLDFFREMFLVTALQKVRENDASACDALEVLKMACFHGAHAMGLTDCDEIAVGKRADIVLIGLDRPNMQPENNILKNIVYSGSKENVRMTMVAGRILYENGEFFTGCDAEKIYADARAIIRRMDG